MALLKVNNTSAILKTLKDTGADAPGNLFEVTILYKDLTLEKLEKNGFQDIFSTRITNFTTPTRGNISVSIPYMGLNIEKISPGSLINHKQTFSFRLDGNYKLYSFLKSMLPSSPEGVLSYKSDKKIDLIEVNAFSIDKFGNFIPKYFWKFYNNKIIDVAQIVFDYNSSQPLTSNVTFIYEKLEEGLCKEDPLTDKKMIF